MAWLVHEQTSLNSTLNACRNDEWLNTPSIVGAGLSVGRSRILAAKHQCQWNTDKGN